MNWTTFGFLGALALGGAYSLVPAHTPDWDKMASMNSVLIGVGVDREDICSGTIIGHGDDKHGAYSIVLTAAHCAHHGDAVYYVSRKIEPGNTEVSRRAWLTGYDKETDVALLRSYIENDNECVPVAYSHTYTRGSVAYVLASPNIDMFQALTRGEVTAPVRWLTISGINHPLFQTDALTVPGASGGATLDSSGYLIGTVTGDMDGTSFSYIAPVDSVNAFIAKYEHEEDICR